MKLYLAGPSGELDRVREIAAKLEADGHKIVDRWWMRVVPGVSDDRLDDATLDASIQKCIEAICLHAEAVVAIPSLLTLRLSTGTAVEVGIALASRWPVLLLGQVNGLPFRTRCRIAPSMDHLLAELREISYAKEVAEMDLAELHAGDDA